MEQHQRRSFTDEYKRQAVDLVASSGRSIGSVAKELGLRDSVLRRWLEHRGARREPTAASRRPTTQAALPSADQAAEISRLQQENERLRSRSCWTTDMRFRFIEDRRVDYPVRVMCDALDVSRAGYYAWRSRP
jgi:transposase